MIRKKIGVTFLEFSMSYKKFRIQKSMAGFERIYVADYVKGVSDWKGREHQNL